MVASHVNEAVIMSLIVNFSTCCPEVYKLDRKLQRKIKLCGVIIDCWESLRGDSSCWHVSIRSGAETQSVGMPVVGGFASKAPGQLVHWA